jgi:hypothetical protein
MRTIRLLLSICLAGALLGSAVLGQGPPKPTKKHALLKRMEGAWDVQMEGGKGTMTYKMDLGGLWLLSEMNGEYGGMKFQGRGMDTYDPATKKYRNVWADSMSTAPMIMEGDFDNDKKVMTMTGEGPGADGKTAKFKTVTEFKDENTMLFSLFALDKDGKEQPMIKITYKRKK